MKRKFLSPVSFLGALLCFLLPFADLRCTNYKDPFGTASGLDFVVGRNLVKEDKGGFVNTKHVELNSAWARLAFVIGMGGLLISFFRNHTEMKRKWSKRAAFASVSCLTGMWLTADVWYREFQEIPFIFEYRFGFYASWGCFLAAGILNHSTPTKVTSENSMALSLPETNLAR